MKYIGIYANINMTIRKFFKCFPDVKCFLFKSYCSSLYCSTLYDCLKTALKNLRIAYNNSLRELLDISRTTVLLKYLFALTFLLLMSYLESMYILSEVDYWYPTTVFYSSCVLQLSLCILLYGLGRNAFSLHCEM